MTRIKICGLTNFEDAMGAAGKGANALGFVFAPRSKRRAEVPAVSEAVKRLPPLVTLVGVFQDQKIWEVREIMSETGLHVAQLHGDEDESYMKALGLPCYKAISLSSESDLDIFNRFPDERSFLLDSGNGGTGKTFDWSLAVKAKKFGSIILAGGLTPENVGEAVKEVAPWGVDTASGVEKEPGRKDPAKVKEFIEAVRGADAAAKRGE